VILKSLFRKSTSPREKLISTFLKRSFFVRPRKTELYAQALCHKSAARNVHNRPELSNERLEFLGDAVIDVVVADFLYAKYPEAEEGELTKMKSRIVSRESLNAMASKMGLDVLIDTDQQAAKSKQSISGNAFEALIGAIYLDHGYATAKKTTLKVFEKYTGAEDLERKEKDFKSRLFEEAHRLRVELSFVTEAEDAYKGSHHFKAEAHFNGNLMGRGEGSSKKKAEQRAAQQALKKIKKEADKFS